MTRIGAGVALAALLLVFLGASRQTTLTMAELQGIRHWMECQECIEEELDTVRAIGTRKPGESVYQLRQTLFTGSPVLRRDSVGQDMTRTLMADSALLVTLMRDSGLVRLMREQPVPMPGANAVPAALASFDEVYRTRSALALGAIRTPWALAALDSALALPLDSNVLRVIRYARDSMP